MIGEVGKMLPDGFPVDVAEAVFDGMRRQVTGLAESASPLHSAARKRGQGYLFGISRAFSRSTPILSNFLGKYEQKDSHFVSQAQQVGLGAALAEQLIAEVVGATESVIGEVGKMLPDGFPVDVAEAVFDGMRRQVTGLAESASPLHSAARKRGQGYLFGISRAFSRSTPILSDFLGK